MLDEDHLRRKLKRLSEVVWEGRAKRAEIDNWLSSFSSNNFQGINEKLYMLHLLSIFLYFGIREIRELLRSLFQTLYQRPLISTIRKQNADSIDVSLIERLLRDAVARSRFLAVGNPAESGQHLLYYFRQENSLPTELFPNHFQLPGVGTANPLHNASSVDRYIFIDDLCGSGQQIENFANQLISPLAHAHPSAEIAYFPLFATRAGLEHTRKHTRFTKVECLMELDDSFSCFSSNSRFFDDAALRAQSADICRRYGSILWARHPLGYKNSQLAIGFNHNTPDNTLPVFWAESTILQTWTPIFRRYMKV
jgi:hypothetical protein